MIPYDKLITTNLLDNSCVTAVIEQLNLLPYKMIKEFYDNDWNIRIIKDSIEFHLGERIPGPDDGFTGGITFWDTRTIYIPAGSPEGCDIPNWYIKFATIHEFGHYLDRSKGYISMSYEFQKIYNAEDRIFCENIGRASNTESCIEYFAESFACYVNDDGKMRELCPLTCAYFDNIFSTYY